MNPSLSKQKKEFCHDNQSQVNFDKNDCILWETSLSPQDSFSVLHNRRFAYYILKHYFTDDPKFENPQTLKKLELIQQMFEEMFENLKVFNVEPNCKNIELQLQIEYLTKIFTFRNQTEVEDYIYKNCFLIGILNKASHKIDEYFPGATKILEVFTNPEANEFKELFICIKTDLERKNAHKQLNKLDREWWLDICHKYNGKLCITLY